MSSGYAYNTFGKMVAYAKEIAEKGDKMVMDAARARSGGNLLVPPQEMMALMKAVKEAVGPMQKLWDAVNAAHKASQRRSRRGMREDVHDVNDPLGGLLQEMMQSAGLEEAGRSYRRKGEFEQAAIGMSWKLTKEVKETILEFLVREDLAADKKSAEHKASTSKAFTGLQRAMARILGAAGRMIDNDMGPSH